MKTNFNSAVLKTNQKKIHQFIIYTEQIGGSSVMWLIAGAGYKTQKRIFRSWLFVKQEIINSVGIVGQKIVGKSLE